MTKKTVTTIIVLSLFAGGGIILICSSGFFIVPKYELATSCDTCVIDGEVMNPQTVWFWRGRTGYTFISSDGGNLMKLKEAGYSFADRVKTSVDMRTSVFQRRIMKLPYSEFLYKVTTGGRPPKKYDPAF